MSTEAERGRGVRHGETMNNRKRPRCSSLELTPRDKRMAKIATPLLILFAAILLRMDFLQPDNFLSSLLVVACFAGIVAIGYSYSQWFEVIDDGRGGGDDDDWLPAQPENNIGNRGRLLSVERAMETVHG
eukprot:213931_1